MSVFPRGVAASVLFRSLFVQGSWNYETLIGTGFAFTILPVLRHLNPSEEALTAAVERHTTLFNSHPYLTTVAAGAVARLESEGADPRMVERFKNALRGSLGSLGDQLIWSAWRPATVLFAILLLLAGTLWWVAVLIFLALYNLLNFGLRIWGWSIGYRGGIQVGTALRDAPIQQFASRIADAGALLGGFATVYALTRLPLQPDRVGFAIIAAVIGIVLGARTRQLFAVLLTLLWIIAHTWAWSR